MKTEEFLAELTALTLKYQIEISGCGCCGSPNLFEMIPGKTGKYICNSNDELLEFVKETE